MQNKSAFALFGVLFVLNAYNPYSSESSLAGESDPSLKPVPQLTHPWIIGIDNMVGDALDAKEKLPRTGLFLNYFALMPNITITFIGTGGENNKSKFDNLVERIYVHPFFHSKYDIKNCMHTFYTVFRAGQIGVQYVVNTITIAGESDGQCVDRHVNDIYMDLVKRGL